MDEFLNFFLSNHLGPNFLLIMSFAISVRKAFLELPEKYRNIKTENDKWDFIYDVMAYIILDSFILIFVALDFLQPEEMLLKFVYFLISLIIVITLIYIDLYYDNEDKDNKGE